MHVRPCTRHQPALWRGELFRELMAKLFLPAYYHLFAASSAQQFSLLTLGSQTRSVRGDQPAFVITRESFWRSRYKRGVARPGQSPPIWRCCLNSNVAALHRACSCSFIHLQSKYMASVRALGKPRWSFAWLLRVLLSVEIFLLLIFVCQPCI